MKNNFFTEPGLREICQRVKIEKIHDKNFNGEHPNKINEGYTRMGFMFRVPRIGERLAVVPWKVITLSHAMNSFVSSEITEIQDGGVIHTENSIYTVLVEKCNSNGHPYWEPLDVDELLASIK